MTGEHDPQNEDLRDALLGVHPRLTQMRRIFRHIPSDPRCKMCLSPQGGIGGPIVSRLGFGRYPRNPQLCNSCFRFWEGKRGGAEIEITALFADIRGSTGLAERMTVGAYSAAVADYVDVAGREIRAVGGIVDKLLGDGIMALFVPAFVGGDHAGMAVRAARGILRSVRLPVGIGVHSGDVWIGFIGSVDGVLDFTALGDPVNVASRLSSEAGAGELLLSARTVELAQIGTEGLASRRLELRGRTAPLDTWAEHIEPAAAGATA